MSCVYILKIDSLSHVFTTLESGSKCQFQFKLINNDNVSDVIQSLAINDVLLCVVEGTIKHALIVKNRANNNVTLEKEFELKEGYEITNDQILSRLNERQIYPVDESFKQDLYRSLKDRFNLMLVQLLEVNVENTQNNPSNSQLSFFFNFSSNFIPSQIIYYGVPGCGKSHQVNEKIKSIPDYNKVRTVFHPEYTNADFIGQILPEVSVDANGHSVVEYKFNPGPFTEIVRRAYLNPDEEFFLVIEEINRGNAAAIFGDMFQLLDRLDADEKPEEVSSEHVYGKNWSSYGVDNPDINAYIRNQIVISQERPDHCSKVAGSGEDANPRLYKSVDIESENVNVTWREKNGNGFTPKPQHLHFSANTAIRLPPNLSIYATMNTSDQNVFTLDNAFQRRWDMELVSNACKWDDEDHKHQAQLPIGDTDIRWETFREAINSEISGGDFFNADDKQLGLFFVEADGERIDQKKFANKVLKYLWADVFKRDTGKIFKSENLSKVVEDFTGADAFDKVFVEDFVQSLKNTNDEIKNHE